MTNETPESQSPTPLQPKPEIGLVPRNNKKYVLVVAAFLLVGALAGAGAYWWLGKTDDKTAQNSQEDKKTDSTDSKSSELALVEGKNYGDKYASGVLPVGDKKYTTDAPKKGSIYMCNANFVPENQAGATTRGPWFVGTTQWNVGKKVAVSGSVNWTPAMTNTVSGPTRVLSTNNLPNHRTGVYPVSSSDAAYKYDRNPNSIKSQSLTYSLTAAPVLLDSPQCMGGEVGVMLTGSAVFNGFDAGGRDAGAWEVQDGCDGHPQISGIYHYHTLSRCIADVGVGTVIGFALDGLPITGPKVGTGNILTTDDLDVCHGITSTVTIDGKKVTTYHYVMTQDFPYSVSCFRAKPIQAPGQHAGGAGQQGGQQGPPGGGQMPPPPRL